MSRPRIVNRLPAFVEDQQRKAGRAMVSALVLGASEASAMTPIDTSNLLNSQFRRVDVEGSRIVGTVGYTAEYALPVHDPDNPQNFRRDAAEKEFLSKGFIRAEPNIRKVIKGAIKV